MHLRIASYGYIYNIYVFYNHRAHLYIFVVHLEEENTNIYNIYMYYNHRVHLYIYLLCI